MRDLACGDCVVNVLIGEVESASRIGAQEARVIDLLASRGMVPPLRFADSADSKEESRRSG